MAPRPEISMYKLNRGRRDNRPRFRSAPKYPVVRKEKHVSSKDAIWLWWRGVVARGYVLEDGTPKTVHWQGNDPKWPDWISIVFLADIATKDIGRMIAPPQLGAFFREVYNDIEKRSFHVKITSRGGQVLRHRCYVFYELGPFRSDPLTYRPSTW